MTIMNFDLGKQTIPAFALAGNARFARPRNIGVLLSNLGAPDGTDYWPVRRYLAEFLPIEGASKHLGSCGSLS